MDRFDQIAAAVDWWAEAIANPKFDNGDNSQHGSMAGMLASMAIAQISEEQKAIFKRELAILLVSRHVPMSITVDYHPDQILGEAMTKAGIPHNNAPWKTGMYLKENREIEVKYGYTGKFETLPV